MTILFTILCTYLVLGVIIVGISLFAYPPQSPIDSIPILILTILWIWPVTYEWYITNKKEYRASRKFTDSKWYSNSFSDHSTGSKTPPT